jgi:hypothetical protein
MPQDRARKSRATFIKGSAASSFAIAAGCAGATPTNRLFPDFVARDIAPHIARHRLHDTRLLQYVLLKSRTRAVIVRHRAVLRK